MFLYGISLTGSNVLIFTNITLVYYTPNIVHKNNSDKITRVNIDC